MTNKARAKVEYAETVGIFFEQLGMPRIAGKIWGWLLVCDPPEQTAADLAEALEISRGSVSTMTRLLIQLQVIERRGLPGKRARYYRIAEGGFTALLQSKAQMSTHMRELAEEGLELVSDDSPESARRLQECRDFYAFFEKEFPALLRKWEKYRKGS